MSRRPKPRAPGHPGSTPSAAFVEYQSDLHRFLVRRLKDREHTADLAQEVFLRMLRIENSEFVRSPLDYLYGVASHVVYQFRMRTRRDLVTYDSEAVDALAEQPAQLDAQDAFSEKLDLQRELERALGALSPTHQAVFLLRKRDGLSIREIADELGLSAHTVKKYIFQASAQIRNQWDGGKE